MATYGMKNYLFFDIECVQVGGQLYPYSFGYVKCDAYYQIIHQEDLLINPDVPFRLDQNGVRVHYSRAEIEASPRFDEQFTLIKSLLEDNQSIVIGHAIENDIQFLSDAIRRYQLPPLTFHFYDSQWMYASVMGRDEPTSLEKIITENRLAMQNAHHSMMDAYYTMMTCRTMERLKGRTLGDIISNYHFLPGLYANDTFRPMNCEDWFLPSVKLQRIKHSLFEYMVSQLVPAKKGPYLGMMFSFNTVFAYSDLARSFVILQAIAAMGGNYTDDGHESDYFLHDYADCNIQDSLSEDSDWKGEFVSYKKLQTMLGIAANPTIDHVGIAHMISRDNLL